MIHYLKYIHPYICGCQGAWVITWSTYTHISVVAKEHDSLLEVHTPIYLWLPRSMSHYLKYIHPYICGCQGAWFITWSTYTHISVVAKEHDSLLEVHTPIYLWLPRSMIHYLKYIHPYICGCQGAWFITWSTYTHISVVAKEHDSLLEVHTAIYLWLPRSMVHYLKYIQPYICGCHGAWVITWSTYSHISVVAKEHDSLLEVHTPIYLWLPRSMIHYLKYIQPYICGCQGAWFITWSTYSHISVVAMEHESLLEVHTAIYLWLPRSMIHYLKYIHPYICGCQGAWFITWSTHTHISVVAKEHDSLLEVHTPIYLWLPRSMIHYLKYIHPYICGCQGAWVITWSTYTHISVVAKEHESLLEVHTPIYLWLPRSMVHYLKYIQPYICGCQGAWVITWSTYTHISVVAKEHDSLLEVHTPIYLWLPRSMIHYLKYIHPYICGCQGAWVITWSTYTHISVVAKEHESLLEVHTPIYLWLPRRMSHYLKDIHPYICGCQGAWFITWSTHTHISVVAKEHESLLEVHTPIYLWLPRSMIHYLKYIHPYICGCQGAWVITWSTYTHISVVAKEHDSLLEVHTPIYLWLPRSMSHYLKYIHPYICGCQGAWVITWSTYSHISVVAKEHESLLEVHTPIYLWLPRSMSHYLKYMYSHISVVAKEHDSLLEVHTPIYLWLPRSMIHYLKYIHPYICGCQGAWFITWSTYTHISVVAKEHESLLEVHTPIYLWLPRSMSITWSTYTHISVVAKEHDSLLEVHTPIYLWLPRSMIHYLKYIHPYICGCQGAWVITWSTYQGAWVITWSTYTHISVVAKEHDSLLEVHTPIYLWLPRSMSHYLKYIHPYICGCQGAWVITWSTYTHISVVAKEHDSLLEVHTAIYLWLPRSMIHYLKYIHPYICGCQGAWVITWSTYTHISVVAKEHDSLLEVHTPIYLWLPRSMSHYLKYIHPYICGCQGAWVITWSTYTHISVVAKEHESLLEVHTPIYLWLPRSMSHYLKYIQPYICGCQGAWVITWSTYTHISVVAKEHESLLEVHTAIYLWLPRSMIHYLKYIHPYICGCQGAWFITWSTYTHISVVAKEHESLLEVHTPIYLWLPRRLTNKHRSTNTSKKEVRWIQIDRTLLRKLSFKSVC